MAQRPMDRGVASWARDSRIGVRARLIAASLRTSLARLVGRGRVEKAAHYDAFISYSHLSDAQLAPALKQGLHAFARPWYRLRALHVFLDNTNLSANPGLWSSIEEALGRARYLILLASPPAAQSPWVGRELQEWCSDGGSGRVLLVLTAGELSWDREAGDFDWTASTAAPRALAGVFADEPRWIDLRSVEELSLRDARFADAVADVAAPLHGQPKDELTGDDVRQHRRTKRLARGAVLLLLGLAAAATVGAFVAVDQRDRAEEQLRVATSRFLGAEAVASATRQHSQSLLLGVEALDASDTSEARDSLYRSLMRLPEAVRYLQPRRGQPTNTAYTADGRRLLVATSGGAIEIRSAATGVPLRVVRMSRTPVIDVDAAPDRPLAVAVDGEGRLRLFDPRTGSLRAPLPTPPGLNRAHTVDFGRDGLVASGHLSGRALIWDSASGEVVARPANRHSLGITDVELDSRNTRLATAGWDSVVILSSLSPSRELWRHHIPAGGSAYAVALSPDGERVAGGFQAGDVTLWRAADGAEIESVDAHENYVNTLDFSADGALLASGSHDYRVRLWDGYTAQPAHRPLTGHISFVQDVSFAPKGRTLVSSGGDGHAVVWNPDRRDRLARPVAAAGPRPVTRVTANPAGAGLAWAEENGSVVVSDARGTDRLLPPVPERSVPALSFSPDGRLLAAAISSGFPVRHHARVWRVATRQPLGPPLRAPDLAMDYLAFDPRRPRLATGSSEVKVWNLVEGGRMRSAGLGRSVAYSPEGDLLAAGTAKADTGLVTLRDAATLRRLRTLETGRNATVFGISFSPDGRILAAGDWDGNVILWDVRSGRRLGEPLTGHTSYVTEVAFSPDGRLLASAQPRGPTLLWDVTTRRPMGPGLGGISPAFSSGGRRLITAVRGGGVVSRPLDTASWRRIACSLANRNLGPAEWEQFMGATAEYSPTCPGRDRGSAATVFVSAD